MPFEGVPQTEKVPSSMLAPTMRRPVAEVKHPKSYEELAAEAASRNQRAAAANKEKAWEEQKQEVDTERPVSPFRELEEEEREKQIELTAQIRERFEKEGYDRNAALGLTTQELQRLKKENEAKEQAEFDAHEREKSETQLRERREADAAYAVAMKEKIAQINARFAQEKRDRPPEDTNIEAENEKKVA